MEQSEVSSMSLKETLLKLDVLCVNTTPLLLPKKLCIILILAQSTTKISSGYQRSPFTSFCIRTIEVHCSHNLNR